MATIDFYSILGVLPTSDDVVIRAAYRALMRKYHPDTNSSADAKQRATEINAAFEVLGDADKRAAYDQKRETQRDETRPFAPPHPPEPPSDESGASDYDGGEEDIETQARCRKNIKRLIWILAIAFLFCGGLYVLINRDEIWPLKNKISVEAALDAQSCTDQGFDVLASITNNSSSSISEYKFTITAYRKGHSNSLANFEMTMDRILDPGATASYCLVRPGWEDGSMYQMTGWDQFNPYASLEDGDIYFRGEVIFANK